MKATAVWNCTVCGGVNLTLLNTADSQPHELRCSACKKAQHIRLTLQNYVKEEAQHGSQ